MILYNNKWLSLMQKDGYVYVHNNAGDGSIVAVLPYRGDEILLRMESRPCWGNGLQLASITGIVDEPTLEAVAKKELLEEAGFDVPIENIHPIGKIKECKCSDSVIYLFAADVSDLEEGEPTTEDVREKDGYCVWLDINGPIDTEDPIVFAMIHKLKEKTW